ncbi:MAG: FG-GAP-like repeat-containing protein [Phycisphaerales bacterium]
MLNSRTPAKGDRSLCRPLFSGAVIAVLAGGALGVDPHYTLVNQQTGFNAITVPIEGYTGQHDLMAGGISVGDFNNDGWPDIYISGLGSVPDMLFINQQDGTFVDEAALWGIDRLHMANGSAVGDVNNDGLPDLYITSFGPADEPAQPGKCLLYINQGSDADGQWSFREEAEIRGVNHIMGIAAGKGAAFGDMDLDGDLDLYAATWEFSPENDGNRLFENDGNGYFTDVTDEMIPDPGFVLRGFTPKFVDVTGDRYPDLLLTCDFATSRLYINNGPDDDGRISFRDETVAAGITADNNGMGATVNDFNGDGKLDWFMTNIFVPSADYFNTLYMGISVNEGGTPTFLDQAVVRGVQNNGWGWGVVSGDYNNDGDIDMVATGGWPQWPNEPTRYWNNDGSGNFNDTSFNTGLSFNINGRGLVHLDYDRDGDLDLVFIDNFGPARIYRNDLEPREFSRFLRIDINTDSHPCLAPMGYGTRVIATYNGAEHLRVIDGASSYLGQSELTVHFGLELTETIHEIRFEWADGSVTTMHDVAADQQLDIHAFHALDLSGDGAINFFDLSLLVQAYISGDDQADINADGMVNAADLTDFLSRYQNPCQ